MSTDVSKERLNRVLKKVDNAELREELVECIVDLVNDSVHDEREATVRAMRVAGKQTVKQSVIIQRGGSAGHSRRRWEGVIPEIGNFLLGE